MFFSGRVHTVIYEDLSQSFYILKMLVTQDDKKVSSDLSDFVTVRGYVPGLVMKIGTWFGFEGTWVNDKKYGRQLNIDKAPVLNDTWNPETVEQMLSGNGVSERVVRQIRTDVGDEKFVKVLSDIEALKEVGLDEFTAIFVNHKWKYVQSYFRTLTFLADLGLPGNKIKQIWSFFGDDAMNILSVNPWALVELDGITFQQTDEIATRLQLNMGDLYRIRGAVLFTCRSQQNFSGHLFLSTGQLLGHVQSLIAGAKAEDVAKVIGDLHRENKIHVDRDCRPGVVAVYDVRAWDMECRAAKMLADRKVKACFGSNGFLKVRPYVDSLISVGPKTEKAANRKKIRLNTVVKQAVKEWGESESLSLSSDQQQGVINALQEPVSVLTGLPGTGKCVTSETLISGPWGMSSFGDLLEDVDIPEHSFFDTSVQLDTSFGVRHATAIYNGGVSDVIRITTKDGYTLAGTPEHPIKVIEDGFFKWRCLKDIKEGDVPVLVRGVQSFGDDFILPGPCLKDAGRRSWAKKYVFPKKMTDDLACVLGYIVAEGSVCSESCWAITTHDKKIQDYLITVFETVFNYTPSMHFDKRYEKYVGVRIGSRQLIRWFRLLGIKPQKASLKTIPFSILRSSKSSIVSFLRGLFEGDGAFLSRGYSIEYGTASWELAYQLHVVLLSLGIRSTFHSRKTFGRTGYRVCIRGNEYNLFRNIVGFHFTELPEKVSSYNTNRDLFYKSSNLFKELLNEIKPKKGKEYNKYYRYAIKGNNSRNPSMEKARVLASLNPSLDVSKRILELTDPKYVYSPVKKITQEKKQVWDFSVPDGHEFLSGGFISHNTTSLRAAVRILQESKIPFLLCAPTGIAAKNLSILTGARAYTIHRAFAAKGKNEVDRESTYAGIVGGADVKKGGFDRDGVWGYGADNTHPAEVVIVDEVSMVDLHLLYRLLTCTSDKCRLVFVGDAAQLPSVGPGNILRDLIESQRFPVVNLTEIFRQKDTSDIVFASHDIHHGKVPKCEAPGDFILKQVGGEITVLETIKQIAVKLYSAREQFQILSPRHKGTVGVTNLNTHLRELLNPRKDGLQELRIGVDTIREDDRIMIVKNNYQLGVHNGDVGKVQRIDRKSKEVELKIFGSSPLIVKIPFSNMFQLVRMAYSCTVHKAQGLEYDYIIMPIVEGFKHQLQRNLLYTAVTRAKKKVILVGDYSALELAVMNDKEDLRNTLLKYRIQSEIPS